MHQENNHFLSQSGTCIVPSSLSDLLICYMIHLLQIILRNCYKFITLCCNLVFHKIWKFSPITNALWMTWNETCAQINLDHSPCSIGVFGQALNLSTSALKLEYCSTNAEYSTKGRSSCQIKHFLLSLFPGWKMLIIVQSNISLASEQEKQSEAHHCHVAIIQSLL